MLDTEADVGNLRVVQGTSFTVTVYVPATRPLRSSDVDSLDQLDVYGATPPLTVRSIYPEEAPLVATSAWVEERTTSVRSVIVT